MDVNRILGLASFLSLSVFDLLQGGILVWNFNSRLCDKEELCFE